jgi:hypothetical protein
MRFTHGFRVFGPTVYQGFHQHLPIKRQTRGLAMPFKQPQAALVAKCGSNIRRIDNVGLFGIGLFILALQIQAGGFNLANADALAEPLYPARYVAHCKPAAPGFGCICDIDSTRQVSTLSPVSSKTRNDIEQIHDVELRRLVEWMRLTCEAITQPRELR